MVDVVTPFAGSDGELAGVIRRLDSLHTDSGDTCTVVDNRPKSDGSAPRGSVTVIAAADRASSYYARNAGAAAGSAEWIVFLDADVEPPPDLIDAYFADPVADDVAVLAGTVVDEPPPDGASFAVRYSAHRMTLSQHNTLERRWGYAQTANCAVRRSAFEAVGGFREDIRSGGDADICFRLRAAGWRLEARPGAQVVHRSRATMRALLRQRMRHGSGAGWLEREHPGSMPGHGSWPGLAKWTVQSAPGAVARYARGSSREEARVALADMAVIWAMELGRLVPNRVPRRG